MRFVKVALCLATGALAVAGAAAERTSGTRLSVVNGGSEQGLKYGSTLLSRPFGAQLVDSLKIVGTYPAGSDRYFLVEGNAGANCPARYLIVTARSGQPPVLSAPFGSCGVGATVHRSGDGILISVAPGPNERWPTRYLFGRAGLRQLDRPSVPAALSAEAQGVRCASAQAAVATDRAAMAAEFERVLPVYYRSDHGIHRADIAPDQLRNMVAALACLANYDDRDQKLPKAATPLFASKRYGTASFAALDQIATQPGSDPQTRASARVFAATMHYFVARREPL